MVLFNQVLAFFEIPLCIEKFGIETIFSILRSDAGEKREFV